MFGHIKLSFNAPQSYTTLQMFGYSCNLSMSFFFMAAYFKHASLILSGKMLWQPSLDHGPNNAVTWQTRATSKFLHHIMSNYMPFLFNLDIPINKEKEK